MTVIVRSFVFPNEPLEKFHLGEPFQFNLAEGTTLGEFVQTMFSKNSGQVGILAVNGRVASEATTLSEGDRIDLYALLDGG